MSGRSDVLEFMELQRKAGVTQRTLQWKFPDKWDTAGRRLCVWCDKPLPQNKKKQRWCGQKCVNEFLAVKGDMGQVRAQLRKRDGEKCVECRQDMRVLMKALELDIETLAKKTLSAKQMLVVWGRWRAWLGQKALLEWDKCAGGFIMQLLTPEALLLTYPMRSRLEGFLRRSLWEADHIVAVADGGSGTDLTNFRTLCRCCHLANSNRQKAQSATKRRDQKGS